MAGLPDGVDERGVSAGPPVLAQGAWTVSRYEDVAAAAADSERFSCRDTNGRSRRALGVLVGVDPPEHTRLRRPLSRALSRSWLESHGARIDAIAVAAVTRFVGRGGGDAVADFAEPLACAVLADVLGLDPTGFAARRRGLGLWPDARREWQAFFRAAIDRRLDEPADDLIGSLLAPVPDGERLREDEILPLLALLAAAGADTARDLLASLLAELAAHPREYERLAADPTLVASAVEESLRYSSPIQAMFRTTACDVDLPGARIPADARAVLHFGAANRDARRWPDASRFDVGRYAHGLADGGGHLAFGAGPHACPGAHLARRVACCVLRELLRHGVRLTLAGPIHRGRNPCFGTLLSLPLRVATGPQTSEFAAP